MKTASWILAALGAGSVVVRAAEPPSEPLPLSVLLDAARATIDACKQSGYAVGVTVVDADLTTRINLRGDGAHEDTLLFSFRKAYTAAKMKMSSAAFGKTIPNSAALDPKPGTGAPPPPPPVNGDEHLITWPGGVPIIVGGKVVGAIGAGGAPGGDKDEVCVRMGIAKIPGARK